MSAYVIDFSDPLKAGFSIPAGGFNGPGGSNANTTLRLYGRGALEWGEAVDEDLVRLAETFASASPPSIAVQGQLWAEVSYYYHNTSASPTSGWWFYDPKLTTTNKWTLLNGTGIVATAAPITPALGQYYLNATTNTLFGFYNLGRYEPATWVPRSHMTGTTNPTATTYPRTALRVRDETAGIWTSPTTTFVSPSTSPPGNPTPGMLWYNTTNGTLNVWTGTTWQQILGPSNTGAGSQASGNLDMQTFRVVNMSDPVNPQDAATRAYVLSAAGAAGVGVYLPLVGGTVTGNLGVNGTLNVPGTTTLGSCLHTGNTTTLGSANFSTIAASGTISTTTGLSANTLSLSGTAFISGQLNMNASRIINLGTPVAASDAATKQYVDGALGGGGVPSIMTSFAGVPATYKAGDIAINAGRVYVAIAGGTNNVVPPGGSWRQIFPAVYA